MGVILVLLFACAARPDAITCADAWCLACRLCPEEASAYVDCDNPPVRPDVESWAFTMEICNLEDEST